MAQQNKLVFEQSNTIPKPPTKKSCKCCSFTIFVTWFSAGLDFGTIKTLHEKLRPPCFSLCFPQMWYFQLKSLNICCHVILSISRSLWSCEGVTICHTNSKEKKQNSQLPNLSGQAWPSIGKFMRRMGHSAFIVNLSEWKRVESNIWFIFDQQLLAKSSPQF